MAQKKLRAMVAVSLLTWVLLIWSPPMEEPFGYLPALMMWIAQAVLFGLTALLSRANRSEVSKLEIYARGLFIKRPSPK